MRRAYEGIRPRDGYISTPVSGLGVSLQFTIGGASMMGRYIIGSMCIISICVAAPSACSMLDRVDTTIKCLGTANNQLMTANAQLSLANRRLAEMQSQITEANRQLVTANRRLDTTQENVAAANSKIDKTNEGLAQTINELGETKTALTQTNSKMGEVNTRLSVIDQVIQKIPILGRPAVSQR